MKCLNCGCINEHYLCDNCSTKDVLDKIFHEIQFYNLETCQNPYLVECAGGFDGKSVMKDIIPDILKRFDFEISEYYYCEYFRICRDIRFEEAAIAYLSKHELENIRTQKILYNLIDSYIPSDLIKPQKWCEIVLDTDDLCCELYAVAAKYFAMIGEYDESDMLVNKGMEICNDSQRRIFLFYSPENMIARLNKQKEDTFRYRTKKPYWPTTEERRRVVAMFYDKKGISYPRIEAKPTKVPENEFVPIKECFDDNLNKYCAFWCSEVFSVSAAKCIYQIAAVKVLNGEVINTFESFIRPWDVTIRAKESAADEAGVSVEVIESAEEVDIVMKKFFDFVGNDILLSTGALGNQAKLISRAARYSGIREIKNEFYDILDFAADTSAEFDLANNNREYLLSYFNIVEGKTAVEKAQVNKQLYDALIGYGE